MSVYLVPYSAVGGAFLFGFLLLILASLTFFMGANILKSCQAMEGPSYEFLSEVYVLLNVITIVTLYIIIIYLHTVMIFQSRCLEFDI